jgi:hypothetical protein
MALKKFKPRSPEIYLSKIKGDAALARLGHLNGLVDDVEKSKANQEIHSIPYPFVFYPESTLFNAGPVYQYPAGMGMGPIPAITLNSYRVRGILPYSGSSVISEYLGTIKIIPSNELFGGPILFPGKITGMVAAVEDGNLFDPTLDVTTTPLADGAKMWDIDAEEFNTLYGVKIMMYAYDENPDPVTEEINYALVLEAYGSVPTTDLATALISYDFEFVSGNSNVTLWWD